MTPFVVSSLPHSQQNFLESVGDYITDICYLACKHKVKLEAAFINAALACEIMEGLASSLYPDMKVQSVALPMVLKAASQPPSLASAPPELRSPALRGGKALQEIHTLSLSKRLASSQEGLLISYMYVL